MQALLPIYRLSYKTNKNQKNPTFYFFLVSLKYTGIF